MSKDVSLFLTKSSQILSSEPVNKFSIVFADPPYASKWYDTAIEELESSNICSDNCLFVVEMSEDRQSLFVPEKFQRTWMKLDERIYGKTKVEFWRRNYD